jgi:iron(III) transport system substrate-binding protein
LNLASRTSAVLRVASATGLCCLLLFVAACGGGDARRPLVVYSAHARDILAEFERAFEAARPEVDVRTVYLGSQELFERLRAERANPQCDVWWGGDATALAVAAEEGLLAPYRPSYASEDFVRDEAWRWTACFMLPMVLGYHPGRVSAADLPKTFAELADPRWKGRLLLREPAASGTMRAFIGSLIAREIAAGRDADAGFALLRGIVANARPYEGKPELLFEALEKGPGDLTVWNLTDLVFQRSVRGYGFLPAPLAEPVPAVYDGVALTPKGVAGPDAAAFYEFVNTPESLARLAEGHARIPVRPTFDRARLRPEIRDFSFTPLAVDAALLRKETAGWMRRFEEESRTARNAPR